jgi:hypothetical protein
VEVRITKLSGYLPWDRRSREPPPLSLSDEAREVQQREFNAKYLKWRQNEEAWAEVEESSRRFGVIVGQLLAGAIWIGLIGWLILR